jgi:hypothetical protein
MGTTLRSDITAPLVHGFLQPCRASKSSNLWNFGNQLKNTGNVVFLGLNIAKTGAKGKKYGE